MHDFVLVAHSNMYLTLTHSMGGLCMCVCIQVFDKCTTPEQMREARREIMKFGPGVLSMVDRILWATAEVGRKVGSHSAAVRKVMIQDVDRGQGSHKDEITFRNENFSLHTAKFFECDAGRKGVATSLLAFAKQALKARSGGDGAFGGVGGADEEQPPNLQPPSAGNVPNSEPGGESNEANMEGALEKSSASVTVDVPAGQEGGQDDLQKRQGAEQEEFRAAKRRKDGKRLVSESAKSTKSKGAKTPSVGGKAAQIATDHPANANGWLVPLQTAMKGAPGVFTHIFDAHVLVTIKQLAVKYGLGMMDYQEAEKPDPINWIALFDFDRVDVDRIATLFAVKQKALWPPMERSAMRHDFVAQKVSLVEWLYNAPPKVCVHT